MKKCFYYIVIFSYEKLDWSYLFWKSKADNHLATASKFCIVFSLLFTKLCNVIEV